MPPAPCARGPRMRTANRSPALRGPGHQEHSVVRLGRAPRSCLGAHSAPLAQARGALRRTAKELERSVTGLTS